jgi:hypothetical protein
VDKDYSVRVTSYSVESRPPEKALRLMVEEPRVDDAAQAEIAGSVTNMGSRDATQVKIVCVL